MIVQHTNSRKRSCTYRKNNRDNCAFEIRTAFCELLVLAREVKGNPTLHVLHHMKKRKERKMLGEDIFWCSKATRLQYSTSDILVISNEPIQKQICARTNKTSFSFTLSVILGPRLASTTTWTARQTSNMAAATLRNAMTIGCFALKARMSHIWQRHDAAHVSFRKRAVSSAA